MPSEMHEALAGVVLEEFHLRAIPVSGQHLSSAVHAPLIP